MTQHDQDELDALDAMRQQYAEERDEALAAFHYAEKRREIADRRVRKLMIYGGTAIVALVVLAVWGWTRG